MKKAQGLSMTTIIISTLAFIVLIFLVAIFTGKIGGFGSDIDTSLDSFKDKCVLPGTNRKCDIATTCNDTNYARNVGTYDCVATGPNPETCCEYY